MVRFAAAAIALAITSLGLSAHGAEILLLDFWSPQCGPCMQMKPTVHALKQAQYPIREVDTTRDRQLSQQFNVDRIPCFVMLVDGREVDREVGATSSQRLQQMFEKAKDVVRQQQGFRGQNAPAAATQSAGPAPQPALEPAAPAEMPTANPTAPAGNPWGLGATPPAAAAQTPASPAAVDPAASADFPPSLIAATVRIRVEDAQGHSFGTGTIIDSRSGEALIITCGHLFRESKGKGAMTVELFEAGPGGTQAVGKTTGQLISYDLERDVALVSIRPDRQVTVAKVAPARTPIGRGDRVATVGCSNGQDPTLMSQRITTLDRYQGPANIEVSGAPEEGRSGGGLFNLQGQLIGICYAADYEGNEGLYAALDSIHGELDRLGLKEIYTRNGPAVAANDAIPPATLASQQSVIRGQEPPMAPLTPIPAPEPAQPLTSLHEGPADVKPSAAAELKPTERAAFEEIERRAANSEVVCIIRPKAPGAESEVIVLGDVSPEFVRALAERQQSPQGPITK
jgi:S1-C subfamily serine protease